MTNGADARSLRTRRVDRAPTDPLTLERDGRGGVVGRFDSVSE